MRDETEERKKKPKSQIVIDDETERLTENKVNTAD